MCHVSWADWTDKVEEEGSLKHCQQKLASGGQSASVRKEQRSESKHDVCEVFSPARTSAAATKCWLRGGWSLDLSQPCKVIGKTWDCLNAEDRIWVKRRIHHDRPELLIVCPPCTLFSSLQNICPNGLPHERCPEKWKEALEMLRFGVELCRIQHHAGRLFAFEHPSTATSWEDESLRELVKESGVLVSLLDMCQYGMVSTDKDGESPVRKTTRIATDAPELVDALSARCGGGHRHVHLVSGRPKGAAIYPPGFCNAILKGFMMYKRRMKAGGRWRGDVNSFENQLNQIGALLNFSRADLCDPEEEVGGRYVDDLKGDELDPQLARAAR